LEADAIAFFWKELRDVVPFELVLDFRRLRYFIALLIRLAVAHEAVVSSDSSLELDEESEELFINSAKTPGLDSSSMMACGILA
jgi:hypothetical protein